MLDVHHRTFPLYKTAAFWPFYDTDSKQGFQQTNVKAGAIGAG
jgi:predicted metal-dependent phosphotriesterase family hydrolase